MKRLMLTCLLFVLLTGCAKAESSKPITLKVVYHNESEFMQNYGNVYNMKYPNVNFEVIPLDPYNKRGLSSANYDALIDNEEPDLLYNFGIEWLVQQGKLINLDPYINQSKSFNLDQINPNLIADLRSKGSGNLYALSNTFVGKALYYNKELFDEYGVEYPVDGMTWNEVFQTAKQFTAMKNRDQADGITGLYYAGQDLFSLATEMAYSQQLRLVDPAGKHAEISSDKWQTIFSEVIEGSRSGYISTMKDVDASLNPLESGLFAEGKAAMTVDYSYLLYNMKEKDFAWDIVSVPVDPVTRGSIFSTIPNQVFGVNSETAHVEEAWKFLEYINGEEFAKLNQMSSVYDSLSAREPYNKQRDKVHLQSFYTVQHVDEPSSPLDLQKSTDIYSIASHTIEVAVQTDYDMDQFMEMLQANMQAVLDRP